MEIFLGNENYFVEGSKNAAIYDLSNERIYELNEKAKESIIHYANKEKLDKKERVFIEDLISKKIIEPKKISKEFVFKKPVYKINFAWLELTSSCNLRCIHCYGDFGCKKEQKEKTLSNEEWFDIIDQLHECGCRSIQLIGGEPLYNLNYHDILEYLNKKEFKRITIFTNATLINENNIKELKKYDVNIRFSLYGYEAKSHEKITGIKGSFDKTINAINLLKENNVNVNVAIVLMKENEKYIEKIKDYVINKLHIDYNGFDVIRPSCVNDNIEHRIESYDLLSKRYYTFPKFKITKTQYIKNHFFNSCWCSKVAITSDGDVLPCIFSRDFVIGNIKKNSLKELHGEILKKWSITKNKIEECKECEYKYACSDCRPLAIGINGGVFSKYPRCCYSPREGVWENIRHITKEINSK